MRYGNAILNYYNRIGHRVGEFLVPGIAVRKTEKHVASFRQNLLKGRIPGPQPRDPSTYASQIPNRVPECLQKLYAWRNGTKGESKVKLGSLNFIPGFYLMRLPEALSAWKIVTDAIAASELYENENTMFLGTSMFPFMHDSTGNHIVLDVNPSSSSYCSVGTFAANGTFSRRSEFRTLSIFFQAHYQCCRDGIYSLNADGYLAHDWKSAENVLERFRVKDA